MQTERKLQAAPREVVAADVAEILATLRNIHALTE